ncbi:MAG: hypothetical protein IKL79_06195 [Clostridia bacterium]|nr:hypothetical protein [Clostridia bacterium]
MAEIIKLLLIALAVYLIFRSVSFTVKRSIMLYKIHSLKKLCNANITLHCFPFSPLPSRGENPDITVEIFNTVYAIRLYSGIAGNRFVHFVDENYSVVYKRVRAMVKPSHAALRYGKGVRLSYSGGERVRIIKQMKCEGGQNAVKILLFSPAPYEVSYVTEEKSKIRLAFTGDELYGYRIFTASTLVTFIDREKRRMENEQKTAAPFE